MHPSHLSAQDHTLSWADNGKAILVRLKDTITINLRGNATTGYIWDVVNPIPSKVQLVERAYAPYRTLVAGGGGVYTFKFLVVSTGSCELIFTHGRPWEKKIPPMETFRVVIEDDGIMHHC
jgi:predicted secreted protein